MIIVHITCRNNKKNFKSKIISYYPLKSVKKQAQISETDSQYELQSKNDQTYIRKNRYLLRKQFKFNKLDWTLEENHLYKQFLEQNMKLLESGFHDRRIGKINVLMSECIKTKTFKQCRSHHQKMMINHKSVSGILKFIEGLQHQNSSLEINLRKQEEGLQRPIENVPVQQMNEEVVEGEGVEIVQTQPIIQQSLHVPILALNDIFERRIEVNLLNCDPYNIQEYFQPNVWWDGSEI